MRLSLVAASTALALTVAGAAHAAPAAATVSAPGSAAPGIVVKDGVTQPVFPFDEAIKESVFVETRVDSDADGRRDRVHLRITRPGATQTEGLKVASLVEPSPYWAGIHDVPNHGVDVDRLPQTPVLVAPPTRPAGGPPSLYLTPAASTESFYVARGYAYVQAESIGSGDSEGCPTTGDGDETAGVKSVVEWLTGKARAWDAEGQPVAASWSTGSVGMMGASYNGTLPNQVAATGVEGLKTIVPIAAISSWYDYYRANGLVVAPGGYQGEDADVLARAVLTRTNPEACAPAMAELERVQDRTTGDHSQFWRDRDYLRRAGMVQASVFITHGLNDWNVKTKQFAQWWEALSEASVPRKLWLHSGGHSRPAAAEWAHAVHRWLDHWLYEVDNGIEREPAATVERPGGVINSYVNWPDPESRPVNLHLSQGRLGEQGPKALESFIDSGATLTAQKLVVEPETRHANRLAYVTPPLTEPTRLSGTPQIVLRASVDNQSAANLTALLVDYDPEGNTPKIVTRGWMDVQNRGDTGVSKPVEPGELYWFQFEQQPKDYVFAPGHQIGLVIISTDYDYTLRPKPGTKLSVREDRSVLILPLVTDAPMPHE
jgi:X-Pro dipeptidyl-peptidase